MREFLRNAWPGWREYTGDGKLAALLLAALFFLCFTRRRKEEEPFFLYAAGMTVCCILPATAAVLMAYQTKFYDYKWIWSLVPLTGVTAWGISLFLTGRWEKEGIRSLPVTALLLVTVLLCGGLGRGFREGDGQERVEVQRTLECLAELYPDTDLCLWGPRAVMEYARETDASIRLPYGRNLWDDFLNAYAYDTYDEGLRAMAGWMDWTEETGEADWTEKRISQEKEIAFAEEASAGGVVTVTLEECAERALEAGVNCVLLPENVLPDTLGRMEEALGTKARRLEGFYVCTFAPEGSMSAELTGVRRSREEP